MYKISDLKEIDKYFLSVQEKVEKKLNNPDLDIYMSKSENGLTSIVIKSLSKNEKIISHIIKNPTIKSVKDDEIEALSNRIVELYNNSKDAYFFYLSDILKKVKLSDVIRDFSLMNKEKKSYRDSSLSPYVYNGSYCEKTYKEKYSNNENTLKAVEEIKINDIKNIYKFLKKSSKKKTSSYKVNDIWEENIFEDILPINNLDNIKFIDTISTSLSLTNRKNEKYNYILKKLILAIYNKKDAQ